MNLLLHQALTAKILLSDATDKICAEQFAARGHEVDAKPGLKKEELLQIIGQYDGKHQIIAHFLFCP